MGGLALADVTSDVGQLEELPARMRPAQRTGHGPHITASAIEVVVSAIGVRLQHALPSGQMLIGIGCRTVAGEVEDRGRRRSTIPGPVITHIGPEPGFLRATSRQKRHGRVIAMQAVTSTHMVLDQGMDRLQRDSGMPDQVCQGRQAQINAFTSKALGLPVQGLVLTILLKDKHGDQAWPGPSTRDRMEGGWRLADLLAGPAGELLAHGLDHFPLTGDHLQRFGDVFAHLNDPVRAAAGAGCRGLDNNPLARQVLGERLAHRVATREGAHRAGFSGCLFHGQGILGGRRFQLLKLQFQLINQPRASF